MENIKTQPLVREKQTTASKKKQSIRTKKTSGLELLFGAALLGAGALALTDSTSEVLKEDPNQWAHDALKQFKQLQFKQPEPYKIKLYDELHIDEESGLFIFGEVSTNNPITSEEDILYLLHFPVKADYEELKSGFIQILDYWETQANFLKFWNNKALKFEVLNTDKLKDIANSIADALASHLKETTAKTNDVSSKGTSSLVSNIATELCEITGIVPAITDDGKIRLGAEGDYKLYEHLFNMYPKDRYLGVITEYKGIPIDTEISNLELLRLLYLKEKITPGKVIKIPKIISTTIKVSSVCFERLTEEVRSLPASTRGLFVLDDFNKYLITDNTTVIECVDIKEMPF